MSQEIIVTVVGRNQSPKNGNIVLEIRPTPKEDAQATPPTAATRIFNYIQQQEIPLEYVASEADIDPEALKEILTGAEPLKATLFHTLCQILKIDLDYFR